MASQMIALSEYCRSPPIREITYPANGAHRLLCVTMLGRLTACDADGNDRLPRVRKTRALLVILALAAPAPMPRSQLIALLWSRREPSQARGSLRQAVYELRVALGPAASLLRAGPGHLALSDVGLQVDAWRLLRAGPTKPDTASQSQGALSPTATTADSRWRIVPWHEPILGDLVGLDPALDGWLSEQCRHLRQHMRTLGEAGLAEADGPLATAAAAERLLVTEPAHEGAWRALIGGHLARGDRAAATQCFELCRAALIAHCEVSPSAETAALIRLVHPQINPAVTPTPGTAVMVLPRRNPRARIRLGVAGLRGDATMGTSDLAAGLAEELLVALARYRWLGCVPCTSEATGHDVDFLLGGSVQRSGDQLLILLRLTDLRAGGEVLWAERFEYDITEIFALQERLASTTAARLEPRLWLWDGERVGAYGSGPRTARDLLRLAVPAIYRLDRRRFMAAGKLLDQSITLDPDDGAALAWAAHWHIFAVGQSWAPDPTASIMRGRALAERAIQLDPEDARGMSMAAHVWSFIDRRPQEALSLHERAIKLNPSVALSWCLSGIAHAYIGQCDTAIDRVLHAQALSPGDPLSYFFEMTLAVAYLLRGDPDNAAQAARRAILLNPSFSSSYKALLAALGHLGRCKAAADARAALLALEPGFTLEQAMHRVPIAAPGGRTLYGDGLRLGGLT